MDAVRTNTVNACIECDEVITNPICSECLAERMRVVVEESDQELAQYITGFSLEGGTTCLFCGKKMSICAHCYSRDMYEFLEERNPKVASEFLSRFDFGLRALYAEG